MRSGDAHAAAETGRAFAGSLDGESGAMHAASLLLLGDSANAIRQLEAVIPQRHRPVYALANLALAQFWAGDLAPALQTFSQAIAEARQRSAQVDPGETGALRRFWFATLVNYALALLKAGRADDAVRAAEEGVRWSEENIWARSTLAAALEAAGQKERAERERVASREAYPIRGLVMMGRRRSMSVVIAHARPGWTAAPEEFTIELGLTREVIPVKAAP